MIAADVEDTGEGIAPEEMGKLFGAFEQTASGIRSRQGTGLGLAIVRQYLNIMGGSIPVELIEEIRKAAEEAEIERLTVLFKELERYDPETAKRLNDMLMRFDYEMILKILSI